RWVHFATMDSDAGWGSQRRHNNPQSSIDNQEGCMPAASRMPRYDVRNDGTGPYAVFYCECCDREFRTQPDLKNTITTDLGRQAAGSLLRKVPLFGGELAQRVTGEDPRYVMNLTVAQLQAHWEQVKDRF